MKDEKERLRILLANSGLGVEGYKKIKRSPSQEGKKIYPSIQYSADELSVHNQNHWQTAIWNSIYRQVVVIEQEAMHILSEMMKNQDKFIRVKDFGGEVI